MSSSVRILSNNGMEGGRKRLQPNLLQPDIYLEELTERTLGSNHL